jgi:nitrilase
MDEAPRNPSMIMGPNGELKAPVMVQEEGILYGDIDLQDCVIPKQFHDFTGYYNRFDIFELTVNRSTNEPVSFTRPRGIREQIDMDLTEDRTAFTPRAQMAAE